MSTASDILDNNGNSLQIHSMFRFSKYDLLTNTFSAEIDKDIIK